VSESRVRVGDETEEAPVRDREVGEADVFGEFDEPEKAGEAGELGGTTKRATLRWPMPQRRMPRRQMSRRQRGPRPPMSRRQTGPRPPMSRRQTGPRPPTVRTSLTRSPGSPSN